MNKLEFAKLYETEKHGQILITVGANNRLPEVKVSFKPSGLGICSISGSFKNTEAGWKAAENVFGAYNEAEAIMAVSSATEEFDLYIPEALACITPFAKLYETEEYGQILVLLDEGPNGPEVCTSFLLGWGGPIEAMNKVYKDSDSGWDEAETYFEKMNEDLAKKIVHDFFEELPF